MYVHIVIFLHNNLYSISILQSDTISGCLKKHVSRFVGYYWDYRSGYFDNKRRRSNLLHETRVESVSLADKFSRCSSSYTRVFRRRRPVNFSEHICISFIRPSFFNGAILSRKRTPTPWAYSYFSTKKFISVNYIQYTYLLGKIQVIYLVW